MIGRFFILIGIVFIIIGIFFLALGPKVIKWRLPGDIIYHRGNFTFYFPLTTCILISIFLTLIFTFIFKK